MTDRALQKSPFVWPIIFIFLFLFRLPVSVFFSNKKFAVTDFVSFFGSYFLECGAEWETANVKLSVEENHLNVVMIVQIFVVIFSPKYVVCVQNAHVYLLFSSLCC